MKAKYILLSMLLLLLLTMGYGSLVNFDFEKRKKKVEKNLKENQGRKKIWDKSRNRR